MDQAAERRQRRKREISRREGGHSQSTRDDALQGPREARDAECDRDAGGVRVGDGDCEGDAGGGAGGLIEPRIGSYRFGAWEVGNSHTGTHRPSTP